MAWWWLGGGYPVGRTLHRATVRFLDTLTPAAPATRLDEGGLTIHPPFPHPRRRPLSPLAAQAALPDVRSVLRVAMRKFFAPNIDRRGRILRAVWGVALITAALLTWAHSRWLSLVLLALGVLGIYEALRGWCLARACGIRTKL